MRVFLITGKGGTGKSTIALALSYVLTQLRYDHLLCEMGAWPFLSEVLGVKEAILPQKIGPHQWFQVWDESTLLKQYVRHWIPWGPFHKWFVDNPITQAFLKSAVGLKELIISGKITAPFRGIDPPSCWKAWVVDGYSSGHFWNILKTPKAILDFFSHGPIYQQSHAIWESLRSPAVQILWVTQSDELSLQETLDFVPQLVDHGMNVTLIANGWLSSQQAELHPELSKWFDFQRSQKHKLHKLNLKLIQLPWLPFKPIQELASALAHELSRSELLL